MTWVWGHKNSPSFYEMLSLLFSTVFAARTGLQASRESISAWHPAMEDWECTDPQLSHHLRGLKLRSSCLFIKYSTIRPSLKPSWLTCLKTWRAWNVHFPGWLLTENLFPKIRVLRLQPHTKICCFWLWFLSSVNSYNLGLPYDTATPSLGGIWNYRTMFQASSGSPAGRTLSHHLQHLYTFQGF